MRKGRDALFTFVGLGPTTVSLVHALVQRGVEPQRISVIDAQRPLGAFGRAVQSIGMRMMRSGWDIGVTSDPEALRRYASARGAVTGLPTPSWNLFRDHALSVWSACGCDQRHGSAVGLERFSSGWRVLTDQYSVIETKNVVIATGLAPHRLRPLQNTVAVPNESDDGLWVSREKWRVAIIGAGLSASHTARSLATGRPVHITMFAPRGLRIADRDSRGEWFDVNPDCLCAPRCSNGEDMRRLLQNMEDPAQRLRFVQNGSIPGSVNLEHAYALRRLMGLEQLKIVQGRVREVHALPLSLYKVRCESGEEYGPFDIVYDARGHSVHVDNLRNIAGLREAIGDAHFQGLPLLDDRTGEVRGQSGLILAGALTTLSYGPVAGVIAGPVAHGRSMAKHLDLLTSR